MGKGKVERELGRSYTLKDIERGIRSRHQLYTFAEQGNMDSVNMIVDAEKALELADPTLKQLQTIYYYWGRGMTLRETGEKLGVSAQAVKFNLELLKVKIKEITDKWDRGEHVTVESMRAEREERRRKAGKKGREKAIKEGRIT